MDTNYIAFIEKPDYDDDEIEEELENLLKMPGAAAFTNQAEKNKIKNKGKKNQTIQLYEKYRKINERNRLRLKLKMDEDEKNLKISAIKSGRGSELKKPSSFEK